MRTLNTLLLTTALAAPLAAEDFRPMADVVKSVCGPTPRLAVACNYGHSKEAVSRLAEAFGGACQVTVVDIHHRGQLGQAQSILVARRPDLMVLLPADGLVRDGSFEATVLVNALSRAGIPSAGTRTKVVNQGALFAIGEGTAGKLLVNQHQVGTIGPIQGETLRSGSKVDAMGSSESPEIDVVALK